MTKNKWIAIQYRARISPERSYNAPNSLELIFAEKDRRDLIEYVRRLHTLFAQHSIEFAGLATKLEAAVDTIPENPHE